MAGPADRASLFTIGEFSQISGLTIKTLRFYHEDGVLVPAQVDPRTGYRYYGAGQIQTARAVAFLRGAAFGLAEIKDLLRECEGGEEGELLVALERQKGVLREKIREFQKVLRSLDRYIAEERQAAIMAQTTYEVQEKVLGPTLIGGIRMKGKYSECGKGFAKIGRSLGRYISGKPLLLHYDAEYKEEEADFEACMPIRQAKVVDGVSVRELPGGRCVSLMHKGPYEQLGHSYARILKYVKEKGYAIAMPTREVYLKGPGMIFKGNPKNYLTEIQMLVEAD